MFLGVDIGTYEAKGVVIDTAGTRIASASRPHRMSVPAPGHAEHDADEVWWEGFRTVVDELLARPGVTAGAIEAIGCSGIGPCVLPLDRTFRPLRPAILYGVDTRATIEGDELTAAIGADRILRETGAALTSQAAGPKIAWIRDHEPDVHAATALFVTCQGYLVGRLTGEWTMDRSTAAYYGPCYSLVDNEWQPEWVELAGASGRLPRLAWSTEVVGAVTGRAAVETGLGVGTPVIAGTADAPAEAVAAGVTSPGDLMVMYGSSIFMIEIVDRLRVDPRLWAAPFVFEDSYIVAGGTSTAGTATRWWLDVLGCSGTDQDDAAFEAIVAEAAAVEPGAGGLVALPHFSGERTPLHDPDARGAIVGLDLTHGRGHIFRAILEGIATGIRWNVDVLGEMGIAPTRVRAVGGGTRNAVWRQAVSDSIGLTQEIVTASSAADGSALLAANGVGRVGRDALGALAPVSDECTPRAEFGPLYDDLSRRALAVYRAVAGTRR